MESYFDQIKCLNNDQKEDLSNEMGGKRISIPPKDSKYNRIRRNKRNVKICKRCEQGATISELIDEFYISERWIIKILKKNGHVIREKRKHSLIEEIKLLLQLGYSVTAIAEKTGKKRQWIHVLIKREGLR